MTKIIDRFMSHVEMVTESSCWIWMASTSIYGYGSFGYENKTQGAHRVSWQLFKGPIPDGLHVLHKCDVAPCVNPDHLFLGTSQDNMTDMVLKGRARWGCESMKLNWGQVQEIRESQESGPVLASRYNVSRVIISRVRRGEAWKMRRT